MNRKELVDAVAQRSQIPKTKAEEAVNAVFETIAGALKAGDKAAFVGFGTFSVAKREARTGLNPQTKEAIQIPAKNVVKFKAGSELAESIK